MINRGEIVLLNYPFTDLSSSQVRPALVISSDNFHKTNQDAIFIFITTKSYQSNFDIRIDHNSQDFQGTGLKSSSTIRVGKLATLNLSLVKRKLGQANPQLLKKVDAVLEYVLGLR